MILIGHEKSPQYALLIEVRLKLNETALRLTLSLTFAVIMMRFYESRME